MTNEEKKLTQEELDNVQGGVNYKKDDLTDPPLPQRKRQPFKNVQLGEGELQGAQGGTVLPVAKKPDGGKDFGGCGTNPEVTDYERQIEPPVQ